MDISTLLYSIKHEDDETRSEYDLTPLNESQFRGGFGFGSKVEVFHSSVTAEDYDGYFVRTIYKLNPPYIAENFLEHHLNFSKEKSKEDLFLKHIKYVILPNIRGSSYFDVVQDWYNKNERMNIQELEVNKTNFLKEAYEVANNYKSSNPFAVGIDPFKLGLRLKIENELTRRIVGDLVREGFIKATIGFKSISVTKNGYDFLLNLLDESSIKKTNEISISSINNSTITIQNNSANSTQTVKTNLIEDDILVEEIFNALEELKKHLDEREFKILERDTSYLKTILKDEKPNQQIVASSKSAVKDILSAIPSNFIANILSQPVLEWLFG